MKKTTVKCACRPDSAMGLTVEQEIEGYECRVDGLDLVVHRLIRGEGKLHTKAWSVTEPRTGLLIASGYGRARAIEEARRVIAESGGRQGVEAQVDRRLADPAGKAAP